MAQKIVRAKKSQKCSSIEEGFSVVWILTFPSADVVADADVVVVMYY